MPANILVIDDDKFIHKVITRSLESVGFTVECALDGKTGIMKAQEYNVDIILLDVEMPGDNGYEVCEKIRQISELNDVAIVFLSSQSTLRERLQGYEVGADDYLTKPFEKEHLIARLKVLEKYQSERRELKAQFKLAQKTALVAMTGTNEISLVMLFMEKSMAHITINETMNSLLETAQKLSIECCLCINREDQGEETQWFSSNNSISPIEKELVELSDKSQRFMDFGCRTVVHFNPVSMLVKNMPLEDMDRYGRLKDLLPVLLSIVNTKLSSIKTYEALIEQSKELQHSFTGIRKNLFSLASTLVENRELSSSLSINAVNDLSMKLMSMGLETDQESYILELIEASFTDTLEAVDIGKQLRSSFTFILNNLTETMGKHESLVDKFILSRTIQESIAIDENDDDVELF